MAAVPADLPIRLVAGLGNPGREYENTRHNAGFLVIDRVAARLGLALGFSTAWQALWGRGADGCTYLKPMTFMNASGRAVRACGGFYKIPAAETLIVYDDLALPLGQLRLRKEGSSGGQNGIQSVIDHLGTTAVPRLRVGIGATGDRRSMVDHVLGQFTAGERGEMDQAIDRAADAVEHARRHGVEAAMNLLTARRARTHRSSPRPATAAQCSEPDPSNKHIMKNRYEGLLVLDTQGKEDTVKDTIERLEKDFAKEGADVEQVQKMEKREFSYAAGALSSGYYVNFIFHAEPTIVDKLRAKFKLDPEVYRQSFQKLRPKKVAKLT